MTNMDSINFFMDEQSKYWFYSSSIRKMFRKSRHKVELMKGDVLAVPGDKITDCYYVDKGIVVSYELRRNNRRVFDFFDHGMFIFLEETMMEYDSALTYEALDDVVLYSIETERVRKLWNNNRDFADHCMKQMSRDYFLMRNLIHKETCHNTLWRVANLILELAVKEGKVEGNKVYLGHKHKKTHMANLLYMNRATFYKNITKLEKMGICSDDEGVVVINDLVALKQFRDSIAEE